MHRAKNFPQVLCTRKKTSFERERKPQSLPFTSSSSSSSSSSPSCVSLHSGFVFASAYGLRCVVQRHTPWAEENSELGEIEVFEVGEQDAPREKFSSGPLHPKKTSFERERKPQSSPFTSSSSSSSSSSPSCVSSIYKMCTSRNMQNFNFAPRNAPQETQQSPFVRLPRGKRH